MFTRGKIHEPSTLSFQGTPLKDAAFFMGEEDSLEMRKATAKNEEDNLRFLLGESLGAGGQTTSECGNPSPRR